LKVYLNNPKDPALPREIVEVEVLKEFPAWFLVKLPDGNIIKRKKNRDIPPSNPK
jgi:hypothetical protein